MDVRREPTLLMQAVEKNNKAALIFLLNVTPKIDVDAQDVDGKTALFLAVFYRYNELLKILLSAGANPDLQNNLGWTPLMQARFQRNYTAIEMLLSAKADTSIKNFNHETIYEMDFGDNNPFITPIIFNKVTTLKNLLQHHIPQNYAYLIQMSLKLKKHHCLEVLLSLKPDLPEGNYLETALHQKDFNSFELLLKSGANPNVKDEFGNTILHSCVYLKEHKYVIALLESKADVNVVDKWNETPLMLAIKKNDAISIKALADSKPNLSFQNSEGESALSLIENQQWLDEKGPNKKKNEAISSHSFFRRYSHSIGFTAGALCVGIFAYQRLLRHTR